MFLLFSLWAFSSIPSNRAAASVMFLCGDSFGFLMAWKVSLLLLLYGGEKKGGEGGDGERRRRFNLGWTRREERKAASAFARCGFERTIRRRRRNPCSRLFVPSYTALSMVCKSHRDNQSIVALHFGSNVIKLGTN